MPPLLQPSERPIQAHVHLALLSITENQLVVHVPYSGKLAVWDIEIPAGRDHFRRKDYVAEAVLAELTTTRAGHEPIYLERGKWACAPMSNYMDRTDGADEHYLFYSWANWEDAVRFGLPHSPEDLHTILPRFQLQLLEAAAKREYRMLRLGGAILSAETYAAFAAFVPHLSAMPADPAMREEGHAPSSYPAQLYLKWNCRTCREPLQFSVAAKDPKYEAEFLMNVKCPSCARKHETSASIQPTAAGFERYWVPAAKYEPGQFKPLKLRPAIG